ncbi:hypothetical protein NEF87_004483 [Candidatus Lokiarchaeum ossiferum]|uniref:Metalloprotease TldD/E C-terminal domain-containing protein n=1 Tax=Candidatus Lokiarchaeum ossiferum TaxID=2951803 RepID=A0ABY6HXT9_9ARCH|nr:hypothetical protein NEF87_004483 [Candidatus Lokiarchaeum sp. B-35]
MSQNEMDSKYNSIETVANLVKSEISKAGIPKYDIYLLDERVNGIYFRKTTIAEQTNYHNISYFIRVFEDKGPENMGIGVVQLNSIRSEDIQKAIEYAQTIAKMNNGPKYDLVAPGKNYPNPVTFDKNVWYHPEEFLNEKSLELRQGLTELIPAVPNFGTLRTYRKQKMLVNSAGLHKLKRSTNFGYEFSFKAMKAGRMAEYWPSGYIKSAQDLKFLERIPEWASRARDALRATPPPYEPSIDVIFAPSIVRSALLATVGYSASAQALFERYSRFKKDKIVASENFTLVDDGLIEGGLGTSAWDSEGNPKQRTPIIENGVMTNFLFDQKFATLLNEYSTGNAQRKPSKGGDMTIEFNNLVVNPGDQSLKEIVANSKKALLLIKFPWIHPNSITGDFGASIDNAYMIENGKMTRPIRGGSVSGNIYEMLKNIDAISKETRTVMNSKVPYIKFKNLHLSSK